MLSHLWDVPRRAPMLVGFAMFRRAPIKRDPNDTARGERARRVLLG